MLCLTQKVSGNNRGISAIIGDYQYFARPCNHIDIDKPEDHPFGSSNIYISGTNNLVYFLYPLRPIRHSAYGLSAAYPVNFRNPEHLYRRHHIRVELPPDSRNAKHYFLYPSHLGRDNIHKDRRWIGCRPTGDIYTHPPKRP